MQPDPVFAIRFHDPAKGHDFILIGIGQIRQNFSDVQGDEIRYEESEEGLPPEYSNRSRISLFGEGIIFGDYDFELMVDYDEEEPVEDELTYFLQVNRDRNYLILGDHREGTFENTTFTALDQYVRGLTLHGEKEKVGLSLMGGLIRGESAVDEISADGTSGPYRLENAPIVEGSEAVRLETRDRADPTSVISSDPQVGGRDYLIDYDDGEITFRRPISESDFRGNPVVIVVTYQYDTIGETFTRSSYGGRMAVRPLDTVEIGATYLADSPWEGDFDSDSLDQRRQIYGSDVTLNFADRYQLGVEVAHSEIPELPEDDLGSNAIQVNLDTNPIDPLRVYGRYWRVEPQFQTFGNRDLASGTVNEVIENEEPFYFKSAYLEFDLDPNIYGNLGTGEETWGLSAAYDLIGYHTLSTGFRQRKENIFEDSEGPELTSRESFVSYKRLHPSKTDFLIGAQLIDDFDEAAARTTDARTFRILGGLHHPFGRYAYIGDASISLAYQYEDFDDAVVPDDHTKIHDGILRLESLPAPDVAVYFEQIERFLYEEIEDDFSLREDQSMLGVEGRINRYFDLDASARFRRRVDLMEDRTTEEEQLYSLFWTSQPWDQFRSILRAEYRDLDDRENASHDVKTVLGGAIYWDVWANLLATVEYDYEVEDREKADTADEKFVLEDILLRLEYRWQDRFSFYGSYRLEKDKLTAEPLEPTVSKVTTYLLGTKYQISDRFDLLGGYRHKILEGAVEDDYIKCYGEVGYQFNRFLKVALGYEYFDYNDPETNEDYEANVGYLTLIGTL